MKETRRTKGFNARGFYNRIGSRYDWFEGLEAQAKTRARRCVELKPGERLLNVGVGTGKEPARLVEQDGGADQFFGVDLSEVMVRLARSRTGSPLCQADARHLPFAAGSFDWLYSAFMLELISTPDLPGVMRQFWQVLKPGGRAVLIGLTAGVNFPSRALVGAWKFAYQLSPFTCGGCRPLELAELLREAGFEVITREVVVQLSMPCEILLARKPPG